MMKRLFEPFFFCALFILITAFASSTQGYRIGSRVENFTLYDLHADSTFTLNAFKGRKALVIVFFANDCAYTKRYFERIEQLHHVYDARQVQFVLINSNKSKLAPQESNSAMRQFIKDHSLTMPYLVDGKSRVATTFGARKNPEAFVLENTGTYFRVCYHGAIDDNPQIATEVSQHYLQQAIEALLQGKKPAIVESPAVGCMIRK